MLEESNLKRMEELLNLKGPALSIIVEIMACYELNELHQLRDSKDALEALRLKLNALPFIKLMTYLKKIEPQLTKNTVLPLQTYPIATLIVDEESDDAIDPLLESKITFEAEEKIVSLTSQLNESFVRHSLLSFRTQHLENQLQRVVSILVF